MNRIFYLAIFIALIGIPAFGIEFDLDAMNNEQSTEVEAESAEAVDTTTIDLGQSSDEEVSGALEDATDVEIVNEEQEAEEPVIAESTDGEDPSANEELKERPTAATLAAEDIPESIRNNQYVKESRRLAALAEETFTYGNYDVSANFAQEAIFYALLSDVYVAIAVAKARIDWAVSSGASKQHPVEFKEAESWYAESIRSRDAEEWENAIDAASKVIDILAYMNAPAGTYPLPAMYTVRSWVTFRDCFWNIAGRPWVYGNPHLWRVLYNANKAKLPNPENPNIIEPGMVLDIPSIKGEVRQGEWNSNRTYGALPK